MTFEVQHIGPLISGISAFLVFLASIGVFNSWKIGKLKKQLEGTTASMQAMLAANIQEAISSLDPDSYFTLDLAFPSGDKLHIPVLVGRPLTVLENISIAVLSHSKRETVLSLVCKGHGHIDPHAHLHSTEDITIIRGTITCLETGRKYEAGDRWTIPAGEFHGANFQDVTAILVHHPPLPRASERPASLEAMSRIFSSYT